jgi:hypothetical protein
LESCKEYLLNWTVWIQCTYLTNWIIVLKRPLVGVGVAQVYKLVKSIALWSQKDYCNAKLEVQWAKPVSLTFHYSNWHDVDHRDPCSIKFWWVPSKKSWVPPVHSSLISVKTLVISKQKWWVQSRIPTDKFASIFGSHMMTCQ